MAVFALSWWDSTSSAISWLDLVRVLVLLNTLITEFSQLSALPQR
ncbi:hypothetical protein [Halomonas sp. BC04]|nr:hypothetical protein [Halomonas sp. BC04]EWH02537.1 hypothetical protein Q427_08210 [Halomonas sp. BC04]